MELRKNPDLDLERKRGMFFGIGLMTSLTFVLAAFQWKVEKGIVVIPEPESLEFSSFMEPVVTSIKQPEPPKPKKQSIAPPVYVQKPEEIEQVVEDLMPPEDPVDFDLVMPPEPTDEEAPSFVDYAEEMPVPNGGLDAFYKFLGKKIRYPHRERKSGIEGKVYVRFIIDIDGSITDLQVIKGVSPGIDAEALRVLSMSPPWKPGRQQYKPVKVRMVLPITFRLN